MPPPPDGLPSSNVLPDWATLLNSLGSLASTFGGTAIQQAQLDAGKAYIGNVGTQGSLAMQGGVFGAGQAYGQQNPYNSSILNGQNPWMQALSQGYMGNQQVINNMLPGLVQGGRANLDPGSAALPANQIYQDPNAANALRSMTNLSGNTGGILNWAAQMLNNGGQTNSQVPLGQYSDTLMAGQNPLQQSLAGAGNNVLGNGGFNQSLVNALNGANGVVQAGGQTALTNALAARGQDLASGNPLLSMGNVASFAQDQAGRNFRNAGQAGAEQAALRGNGPGDIVASGSGNQAQRDNADQALAGTATAVQQALQSQQGLNLQQLAQGLNTSLSAADIQRSLELGGLGAVGGLNNSATSALGTGGGLVQGALGAGTQGAGLYNALLGLQQGNTAQGIQAGLGGIGQQAGISQQAVADLLGGQTGAANLGNLLSQLYMQNNQGNLSGINSGLSAGNSAAGQYGSQGSSMLGYGENGLNLLGSTAGSMANLLRIPNQFGTALTNFGAGSPLLGSNGSGGIKINVTTPGINLGGGGGNGGGGGLFTGTNGDFATLAGRGGSPRTLGNI